MKWKEFSLNRKGGHPEPGQLCVVRRLYEGKAEYVVGQLIRDPRDKSSVKLWWQDGRSCWTENPARWRIRYSDILWAAIAPPEEVKD